MVYNEYVFPARARILCTPPAGPVSPLGGALLPAMDMTGTGAAAAHPGGSRMERWALPAILMVFVFILGITKVVDPDTFWHIKTGELIVSTLSLPRTDPFTCTLEGEPWANTEWLSQVLFYGAYAAGGIPALTVFKAAVAALAALLLFIHWRRSPLQAFAMTGTIAWISRLRFTERPHIFSFLFLSITVVILDAYRNRGRDRVWLLPLLMVVWANAHPGFIVGLGYFGVVWAGEILAVLIPRALPAGSAPPMDRRRLRRLSVFFALTAAASLLNINGYRALSLLKGHIVLESVRGGMISEFLPLTIHDPATAPALLYLLILSALCAGSLFLRPRGTDVRLLLLLPVFGLPALLMRRFIAEFLIATLPLAMDCLRRLPTPVLSDPWARRARSLALAVLILSPIPVLAHLRATDIYHLLGTGIHPQFYPAGAIRALAAAGISGNVYNSQSFGGALIFSLFPGIKVFSDTRLISYEKIIPRVNKARKDPELFNMLLSLYKVEAAVVQTEQDADYAARGLFPRDRWALIYWDDLSNVFVRRLPRYAPLIRAGEYRITDGETLLSALPGLLTDADARTAARKELDTLLAANPNVSKARFARGEILGTGDAAAGEFRRAIEIEPSFPEPREALGRILHLQGNFREAREQYADALRLREAFGDPPSSLSSLLNELGVICMAMGDGRHARSYLSRAAALDPGNAAIQANLRSARGL